MKIPIFCFIVPLICLYAYPDLLVAQGNRPAAPPERKILPTDLQNRFQVGLFVNASYNVFKGRYYGDCPCEFIRSGNGFNVPFGLSVNIPLGNEASIYVRGGMNSANISFEAARQDSLYTLPEIGEMYEDLSIDYSMLYFELLLRLIAQEDGLRILAGPTFGFVREQKVKLIETEYKTGQSFVIEDRELEDAMDVRYGFILGIEYAFVPHSRVYLIPSLSFDYGMKNISLSQPLRPLLYHFSVTVAYQL